MSADGRSKEWIALSGNTEWERIALAMPTQEVVGTVTVGFVTLLPANIAAGGDVTLLRIVGTIAIANQVSGNTTTSTKSLGLNIQLVQTRHGSTGPGSLDTFNASDLDSSNFLWRHMYPPGLSQSINHTPLFLGGGDDQPGIIQPTYTIDLRVKRRFDRSQWALVLGFTALTTEINTWGVAFLLRGLFLTSGGI